VKKTSKAVKPVAKTTAKLKPTKAENASSDQEEITTSARKVAKKPNSLKGKLAAAMNTKKAAKSETEVVQAPRKAATAKPAKAGSSLKSAVKKSAKDGTLAP
jgi:hypothetical protein